MSASPGGILIEPELADSIDEVVECVLSQCRVTSPPVDAIALARRLRVALSRKNLAARGSRPRRAGGRTDFECPFDAQRHAAAAIGRARLTEVRRRIRSLPVRPSVDAAARLGAHFAARLLVPVRWFRSDVCRLGHDLGRLHARYNTASLEAVAWRLLDLDRPVVVTILDNGHIVERRGNVGDDPRLVGLTPAELSAVAYCHQFSRPRLENAPGVTARAWPVHRADWRREIVVALVEVESGELAG